MSIELIFKACLLGIVQGITEFLPISSSAHVVLLSGILGDFGKHTKSMLIFLQGVSILAVMRLYWQFLRKTLTINTVTSRSLLKSIAFGALPFMIVGFISHKFIFLYLFSPSIVSAFLILGGVVLIFVNYFFHRNYFCKINSVDFIEPKHGFMVGLGQILAIFPGVSRSGATIVGGLLCGMTRPVAVQFSFLLAIPLLFSVSIFQLLSVVGVLTFDEWLIMGVASVVTVGVSCAVVGRLFDFLSYGRNSFFLIGIYRVCLGLGLFYWSAR
ncbi:MULTISPECIES: undecaprenyl-diphosphate phosphatase [Candidatus Ichthyocystis]|uniref:Undecaprenyl-diphosphatase n=1 Tax=Candidatus Ichthyocystis hellenicum TaxID=1561003 RepID=A0A0S4M503_9BURK|nr:MULTISPECIES: undecaprenyl-diphosphate phosphatase [Ichthyocystis]CUT17224.1 Undecaprenyl-diphosphatase [Candidatus Ichthyocystis hellenicum]